MTVRAGSGKQQANCVAPRGSKPKSRIRLSVRPRKAVARRRIRYRIRATYFAEGGKRKPARKVAIRFAGRTLHGRQGPGGGAYPRGEAWPRPGPRITPWPGHGQGVRPGAPLNVGLGAFISVGRSLDTAVERVGSPSGSATSRSTSRTSPAATRCPVLAAYAARTERIRLGTGVIPIYTRTPATMAQTAATIDEISGGRLILGIGVSHRRTVEAWYGQTIDKPVAEMREYVGDPARDPRAARTRRRATKSCTTGFRFIGYEARAGPPDLHRRAVARDAAAGRRARRRRDPLALQPGLHPRRRRARGDRRAASGPARRSTGFDIVAAVPSAVTDDAGQARATLRARPDPLLLAAVLPRDDRAVGLRRRHRGLRRGHGRGRRGRRRRARSRTSSSRR